MSKRCSYCENPLPQSHNSPNLICRRCKSVKNRAFRNNEIFNSSTAATLIEQDRQRVQIQYILDTYGHPHDYVVPHPISGGRDARAYYKRRGWINTIQYGEGCIDCGEIDVIVLSFDHRPNSGKLFNIGGSESKGADAVLAEIAKCDVRCHNCHARRTHSNMYTVTNIANAPVQLALDSLVSI